MSQRTSAYVSLFLDAPTSVGRPIALWQTELVKTAFPADRFFAIYRFAQGLERQVGEAMTVIDDVLPEVRVETRNRGLEIADVQAYLDAVTALRLGALDAMPKTALSDDPKGDTYTLGHIALDKDGKPIIREAASADAAPLGPLLAAVQTAVQRFAPSSA